jgi:D-alanyl-lipoteichoic acid acyltransferase DltB (MBOAT superfamily)
MPLGISFYIFQIITYSVDIYREKIEPTSLRNFSLFVSFFPKLIVGPIAPAAQFLPQLDRPVILTRANLEAGAALFIVGLVKKNLLADSLTPFVDEIFAHPALYDGVSLFSAAIGYSMQIYCDFSGYSDMAIGIALILGFTLPANFNYPYRAVSVTDFWRRWHISLSSWLRDYLYIPLGGSRKGTGRTYLNLFITFFLCGLWHGAGITYIFWGVFHGLGLIIHKAWQTMQQQFGRVRGSHQAATASFLTGTIAILVTYLFVTTGWILFRSPGMPDALLFFQRIISNADGVRWIHLSFYLITPFFLVWHLLPGNRLLFEKLVRFDTVSGLTVSLGLVMLVLLFSPMETSPFIYFQF